MSKLALLLYDDSSPDHLHEAIRYALAGKGKRVRGCLAILVAEGLGDQDQCGLVAACAVEWIHAYSLVHDDLPCIDNDDLRRGRPTVHRRYSEATAVLVGDALLTDAFLILTDTDRFKDIFDTKSHLSSSRRLECVRLLARSAGGRGMVLGQDLDIKNHLISSETLNLKSLEQIHNLKTGYLMGAACALGGLCAPYEVKEANVSLLWNFGVQLGLSFQVYDDVLDGEEGTGKSVGKDAAAGKLSYLSIMGREKALSYARSLANDAFASLEDSGIFKEGGLEGLRAFVEELNKRKF